MSLKGTVQQKPFFVHVKRRNYTVGGILSGVVVRMCGGFGATEPEKQNYEK